MRSRYSVSSAIRSSSGNHPGHVQRDRRDTRRRDGRVGPGRPLRADPPDLALRQRVRLPSDRRIMTTEAHSRPTDTRRVTTGDGDGGHRRRRTRNRTRRPDPSRRFARPAPLREWDSSSCRCSRPLDTSSPAKGSPFRGMPHGQPRNLVDHEGPLSSACFPDSGWRTGGTVR